MSAPKTTPGPTAERVAHFFNLSDESFNALPRGLASELDAVVRKVDENAARIANLEALLAEKQRQCDALTDACSLALEKLDTTGEYPGIADTLRANRLSLNHD